MKNLLFILLALVSFTASAQKIDSIYFNLYTDSLKKGVHNYINVDGRNSTGSFLPLMTNDVAFSSTSGKWEGNSLIFEREFKIDLVTITAWLKEQPAIKKSVTVYLKKLEIEPSLKTEKELLEEWQKKPGKRNN